MYFATKRRQTQILVWLIWAVACLVFWAWPEQAVVGDRSVPDLPALPGVVTHDPGNGPLLTVWQSASILGSMKTKIGGALPLEGKNERII
jgi:hypothetical protein